MRKKYLLSTPPLHARLPRSPLEDERKIVAVQQSRSKWQCKPVCKMYVKPAYNSTGRKCSNFFIVKNLVNERGMTIDEAIAYAKTL